MKTLNLKWFQTLWFSLWNFILFLSNTLFSAHFLFAFDDPPSLFELILLTWERTLRWAIKKYNGLSFFSVIFDSTLDLGCSSFIVKAFQWRLLMCRSSWHVRFNFRLARISRNDLWRFNVGYCVWIWQQFQEFLVAAVSASLFCLNNIIPELWFIDDDCLHISPFWYRVLDCDSITFSEPSDIFDLFHLAMVTLHGFLTF